ncbi:distal membrane-arm assembly complex protein 2 [Halichoeres trimaculatus]|uniref:distal membrane-arm assembly complex protein 2 n=1 Tax=Halichoeres trimaculatus TaxID=147232 RepID=UPI003D9EF863
MSAPIMSLLRCYQRSALLCSTRQLWTSSSESHAPLHRRLFLYLTQRFLDIEVIHDWIAERRMLKLEKKNACYASTGETYGPNISAAYFILRMKGGFRFVGQSEWFLSDRRGKINSGFLNYPETQLRDVNMSHSLINYTGLDNLVGQQSLQTLSLRGCSEVDDWFLAKLHMFGNSLEELDISHCPQITVGGLAALRHLKGLKRLDISSLPKITNPGMVVLLLEEMLPECQVTATGYDLSLKQEGEAVAEEHMQAQR